MNKKVRKAVIPVAGFGTRFLPATKAQPKEMLPLVDKPIIQYVVEDVISAGIEDVILVTGWHKRNIEDHFDYPFELEKRLEEAGKEKQLEEIRRIAEMANFYYVRQKGPMGNGTPIWNARHLIGDEPFLVLWGDEIVEGSPKTRSQQLVEAYEKHGGSAVVGAIHSTRDEDYNRYGYAQGQKIDENTIKIEKFIEKPGPGNIDSPYAIVGGYVFSPDFFPAIEEAKRNLEQRNTPDELYWADGMNILLRDGKDAYAVMIENAKYHDCGNKLEYLKAMIQFGLKHEEIGADLTQFIKDLKI